jgi:N-acetylated-alpha-linked acidic dipeptidase
VRSKLPAGTGPALQPINVRLMQAERQLIDPAGLPRRPWYRHLLYAPGFYTGYAVKTMPGVREGIEEKKYDEAEAEVVRLAKALDRETALLNAVSADLDKLR